MLCAVHARSTDLTVTKLVLPPPTVTLGTPALIVFNVANINVLPALEYTIAVAVTHKTSGNVVFNEVVAGIPIQPNTEVEHRTEQVWNALVAGTYDVSLSINFADDINTSNNTQHYAVVVSEQPLLRIAAYYLLWRNMYATSFFGDAAFDMMLTRPSLKWQYANVFIALSRQAAAQWILRNILLPPTLAPYTFNVRADLSMLIPNTTTKKPDSLHVRVAVTDSPVTDPSTLPETEPYSIQYNPKELSISYGLRSEFDYPLSTFILPTTTTVKKLQDTVYRGCTVPNMDLDSSKNNPSSVPGYAGDLNACAPTAAANSMQWLEDSNPNIKSGLTHRKKLEALSKAMKRANNTGVWIEDFIRGKLEYIAANNLPISVKFQVRGLTKDVTNFPESDYDATATNKGTGTYPSFDFVKKEMADSEDVETFVEYHDPDGDSSKVVGRHVITCTGAAKDSAGNKTFWYKDDGDQRNAGGTRESEVGWVVFNDSIPYIESYDLGGGKRRITVPYGVVSESYDPSVKQKEKGFFEMLRDAAVGVAGRYEHGDPVDWKKSHPIRFMHLFRRRRGGDVQGGEPAPEWVLKNMPIGDVFGPGTFTLLDPQTLIPSATDSVEARVLYTDNAVTVAPTFDGSYRWYSLTTNNSPSLGGALVDSAEASADGSVDAPMPEPDGMPYAITRSIQPEFDEAAQLDISSSSKQGSSSIRGVAAMLRHIDHTRTEVSLTADLLDQLTSLCQFNATEHGVSRSNFLGGLVTAIDDQGAQITGRFQSRYMLTGNVASSRPFAHALINESTTDGVNMSWLATQLQKGPVLVEVGMYDAIKRVRGFWMVVTGLVEHNGMQRLLGVVDVNEDEAGGLRHLVGTTFAVKGSRYIAEWSTSALRAELVSAVSLEYDPTLTFTGVNEPIIADAFDIHVAPQPATEQITITWSQAQSTQANISLVDYTGREVLAGSITSESRRFVWNVNAQTLSTGTYMLVIRSTRGVTSAPVVVIH